MGPGFGRGVLPSARGPYEAPAIPTTKDVLNVLTLLKRMYRRLPDALMAQWVSGPRGLVATTVYSMMGGARISDKLPCFILLSWGSLTRLPRTPEGA